MMFWQKLSTVVSPTRKPKPAVFSEHFMADWIERGDENEQWGISSIYRICRKEPGTIVFYCWTREDAIELMKRLDPIEADRIAAMSGGKLEIPSE